MLCAEAPWSSHQHRLPDVAGPRLYRETPAASEMPYHKRAAKELRRLAEAEAARAAAALATAASADGNAGPAANGNEPATAEAGDAAPAAAAAAVAASDWPGSWRELPVQRRASAMMRRPLRERHRLITVSRA